MEKTGNKTLLDLSASKSCIYTFGYVCSFSLFAPKENEPKEMRFSAAQIPAKIGVHSLNGENLMRSTPFRTSSGSSPFLTLAYRRFFHAVLCKAARLRNRIVFLDVADKTFTPEG